MKNDVLRIFLIELILIFFIFFNTFVFHFSYYFFVVILVLVLLYLYFLIGKKRVKFYHEKEVNALMFILGIVYLILFYLLGLYFGFYHSVIKLSLKNIFVYVIPLIFICGITEAIRSFFISRKNKLLIIVGMISLILLDISIYHNTGIDYDLSGILNFVGYNVLTTISFHLLYYYICKNYGYKANILFKIIINVYPYIISIIPNVYIFIRILLKIVSCFIIYYLLDYLYAKRDDRYHVETLTDKILWFLSLFSVIVFCVLISCKFKYCMLVIGSGSMTGTINKGDAIIFEKYENQKLEVGDIIVFQMKDKVTIHRIVKILDDVNEIKYVTKGDANIQEDDGYVKENLIIGIEKIKIPYMGIPSVWLKECMG